jgi:two-component system, OmpR family, response regulator
MTAPSPETSDSMSIRSLVYDTLQLLLVEDDELQRKRLELLISTAKFDVVAVNSVQEARRAMDALVFPVVVIDRKLGDGDGIELISELRKRYTQHSVFLMLFSALDSDEDRRDGLQAGADAYLSKRASDDELLRCLAAARDKVRLRSK